MKAFFHDDHWLHRPETFFQRGQIKPSPERPERAALLKEGARQAGLVLTQAADRGLAPVQAVHDQGYLDYLQSAAERWRSLGGSAGEVLPNVHPNRHMGRSHSTHVVAEAGFYQCDGAAPIGAGTWSGARAAASVAVNAAQAVMNGDHASYGLARPPGHHAYPDMAGGFCFLNNTAIAAQHCLDHGAGTVAVLDVDVHHGNGTQGVFYRRADVLTVSLHGDPAEFYPFYAGFDDECGEGPGRGSNLNIPLPRGTADARYLQRLEDALERIAAFAPDVIVVALGLDASEQDPLAFLSITTDGFEAIGRRLGSLPTPVVLIQEGGYISPILGANLEAVLRGFQSSRGKP